jgi:hypothetical protein
MMEFLLNELRVDRNRRIRHGKSVTPRKDWSSPAEGQVTVQQWHGKSRRETTQRCPVAQQWHDSREQKHHSEKVWTPQEIGIHQQGNAPPCESGTEEGKCRWEKTHQGHD